MPALTNPRHERFAQELARGKTASEAYVLAGYKANDGNASTLKGNQKVEARIAEILERGALRAEVNVATLTTDLLRLRDKGEALGDAAGLSVARNSVMDIAKLNGLVIDKAEIAADIGLKPNVIEFVAPDAGPD